MNNILIKKFISKLFSMSRVLSTLERYSLSDKAFILMYHRVLDSVDSCELYIQPGMFVTTASFEKQIVFLKDRFKVVFLEDLVEKALSGEGIGGHCAITFDDGWRDNYTHAFPILEKYCVPATIFLATGFVGTDRLFWPEEICSYLDECITNKYVFIDAPLPLIRFNEEIRRYHRCKRETLFNRSIEILKEFSQKERGEILRYLRGMFRIDPPLRQILSWEEAREMLESGLVRFGAHTVNHEILDQVSCRMAEIEVSGSREEIERRLGCKVESFAYPNGNRNESIVRFVAESGFLAAVTTDKGFMVRETPIMEVPRIAVHEDVSSTIPMFRSRILFSKF